MFKIAVMLGVGALLLLSFVIKLFEYFENRDRHDKGDLNAGLKAWVITASSRENCPPLTKPEEWAKFPYSDLWEWFWRGVEELVFIENTDFTVSPKIDEDPSVKWPTPEFTPSRDMAFHLAMLADTAQGKQVRSYLMDCERRVEALFPHPDDPSGVDAFFAMLNKGKR